MTWFVFGQFSLGPWLELFGSETESIFLSNQMSLDNYNAPHDPGLHKYVWNTFHLFGALFKPPDHLKISRVVFSRPVTRMSPRLPTAYTKRIWRDLRLSQSWCVHRR